MTAGAYDSGEIASPGANVTVTATIGGKSFRAVLAPRAFAAGVEVAGTATSVTVHGADPNGGAVALELSGPGGVLARRSAFPRAGGGLDASATFALAGPGGSVVTVDAGRMDDAHAARKRRIHAGRLRRVDPRLAGRLRRSAHLRLRELRVGARLP